MNGNNIHAYSSSTSRKRGESFGSMVFPKTISSNSCLLQKKPNVVLKPSKGNTHYFNMISGLRQDFVPVTASFSPSCKHIFRQIKGHGIPILGKLLQGVDFTDNVELIETNKQKL